MPSCYVFCNAFIPSTVDTLIKKSVHELCKGTTIKISKPGYPSALWNDGSTATERTLPSTSATYWVKGYKDCSYFVDTFLIKEKLPEYKYFVKDTTLCEGVVYTINSRLGSDSVKWEDGSVAISKKISYPGGKYWCHSFKNCSVDVDTFIVKFLPKRNLIDSIDKTVCFLPYLKIEAPTSYNEYLWNNGSTSDNIIVYNDSIYILKAKNNQNCETLTSTYKIKFINLLAPLKDTAFCKGDSLLMNAKVDRPMVSYLWSTGATEPSIKIGMPGMISINIKVEGCELDKRINIKENTFTLVIDGSKQICQGKESLLKVNLDNALYLWNTGDNTQSIQIIDSGKYSVRVIKEGCQDSAYTEVQSVNCDNCIYFPNAFTPNNDGKNDYFKPIVNCPLKSYNLIIVNRWGAIIFSSSDPREGWTGRVNNNEQEIGTYFYQLKVEVDFPEASEQFLYKGDVMLIR